jgi:hypothetical protein
MTEDTRVLTEYERGLLAPYLQRYQEAEAEMKAAVHLLAGEAWKGTRFDCQAMTFTRIPSPEPTRPFAQDPPAGPQAGQLSASAES